MKRRVLRVKANRKALRHYQSVFDGRPPYFVLCDASFFRTLHEAKVEPRQVQTLLEEGFCGATCVPCYTLPTEAALTKKSPDVVPMLGSCRRVSLSSGDAEKREARAIVEYALSTQPGGSNALKGRVYFAATQTHDTRAELVARRVPAVHLSLAPAAVWVDPPPAAGAVTPAATTAAAAAAAAATPGKVVLSSVPAKDRAFMQHLVNTKQMASPAPPRGALGRNAPAAAPSAAVSGPAHATPVLPAASVGTAATEGASSEVKPEGTDEADAVVPPPRRRQAPKGANPLAARKRQPKERFVSSDLLDEEGGAEETDAADAGAKRSRRRRRVEGKK